MNPYIWNEVKPELCYGRDALLGELLSGLPGSPRYSFGLAGGRRMGKSTVLRRVELELKASINQWLTGGLRVIPIYVDGLALPRPLTAADVWGWLLQELQRVLPESLLQIGDLLDFMAFKDIVQPILINLPERPRVIILFDEIEPITICSWSSGFWANWRALLSNSPGLSEYFTAVFAGAQELANLRHDIGSPLADVLEWRSLRCLEFEDACALVEEPIEQKWPMLFLARIYQETGGHPFLLQYIMHQVCNAIEVEAEQVIDQAINKFTKERRWQFSEWWGRYCTETARRVYNRLPDDGSTLPRRTLTREFGLDATDKALEILQHVGLVAAEEDDLAFRYTGEMFRRWYRSNGILTEAPLHDSEIQARLAKIRPEMADKYLAAWGIYQAELPNYSGAVSEMRDTLRILLDEIAPNEAIMSSPNFKIEKDRKEPTQRQRARYAAMQQHSSKERSNEIAADVGLLETELDQLADIVVKAYGSASGLTHTTATREATYRALKQLDSILAQLTQRS